jgi:hypothetical protein
MPKPRTQKSNQITVDQFTEAMDEILNVIDRNHKETQEQIKYLPTKDEFYAETSKIYKKVQDIDDQGDILSHRVYNHEDRITTVETKLKISIN